ncbi:hypothetical protein GCM10009754_55460 [Amycolatopsis minnesotensis]|uniref:Uncharacterized protein n=1 Tax=Amycolatopsis minnesotensis TaxID=337894 RepID=A0ABN2RR47_9PSEU
MPDERGDALPQREYLVHDPQLLVDLQRAGLRAERAAAPHGTPGGFDHPDPHPSAQQFPRRHQSDRARAHDQDIHWIR